MVALQIRDVPEQVRDLLAARARAQGQSLQSYLLAVVEREAGFVRNLELLDELDAWSADSSEATLEDVLAVLDEARR